MPQDASLSGWSFLAVFILPSLYAWAKTALNTFRVRTRPLSLSERVRVMLLAGMALGHLYKAIEGATGERCNVFSLTQSRLQSSNSVLTNRLVTMGYPPLSGSLANLLSDLGGRLLYLRLGAKPFDACIWCTMDSPATYLLYLLPSLGLSYISHISFSALLSDWNKGRRALVVVVLASATLELYARSGNLDTNIMATGHDDFLDINMWCTVLRNSTFMSSYIFSALLIVFQSEEQIVSPEQIAIDLVQTIEGLRASNSINRTVLEDSGLGEYRDRYWKNQLAARQKAMEKEPQEVRQARDDARARFDLVLQPELETFMDKMIS